MGVEISSRDLKPGQDGFGNALTGAETMSRDVLAQSADTASGEVRLSYFTPQVQITVANALTATGGSAAAATPTLCKVGLYSVASNGDLTLVASTANTTSLWASTGTLYTTALTASYTFIPGQRYAAGHLIVTGGATPNFAAAPSASAAGSIFGLAPRLVGRITGQTDLPASIASGDLLSVFFRYWVGFTA